MAFTGMAIGWVLTGVVLCVFLRRMKRRSQRLLWAALIGAGAGMGRAFVACAGCLLFANTDSWLQVPAYLMIMFALPEAVLFPTNYLRPGTSLADGWAILARLAGTILVSSLTLAMAAALLAEIARPRVVVKSQ
jgi:hypothetical protein